MMTRLCYGCNEFLGYKPGPDVVTHGVCDACLYKHCQEAFPETADEVYAKLVDGTTKEATMRATLSADADVELRDTTQRLEFKTNTRGRKK